MTFEEFNLTLQDSSPPVFDNETLTALWHHAKGEWDVAHNMAQGKEGTRQFDRLHAFLHRDEGDAFNAKYWYSRAGSQEYMGSLHEEWKSLVENALTTNE